ncbi:MAG: hypothetical protein ACJ8KF_02315 [Chthoniobacterales bacterium]
MNPHEGKNSLALSRNSFSFYRLSDPDSISAQRDHGVQGISSKHFIGVEEIVQVFEFLRRKLGQTSNLFFFVVHQLLDRFTLFDAYPDNEKSIMFGNSFFGLIFHVYFFLFFSRKGGMEKSCERMVAIRASKKSSPLSHLNEA